MHIPFGAGAPPPGGPAGGPPAGMPPPGGPGGSFPPDFLPMMPGPGIPSGGPGGMPGPRILPAAGGPSFPPLMPPPAMGMLMPEMTIGPMGLPGMVRKPKNMQPPTQDMSIPPNQTIYINNINDKVKLPELKENLRSMFKQFGEIRQIVAMSSFWRRGQAWIVFASVESATKAIQGMQGFVYHDQPLRINYSVTKSDIIAKEDGTFTPRPPGPKKPRAIREREERQRELFLQMQQQYMQMQASSNAAATTGAAPSAPGNLSQGQANLETMGVLKRKAEGALPTPQPAKLGGPFPPAAPVPPPAVDMNFPAMPNKVLFLENLPEDATMEGLVSLFSKHAGMIEVRPVLWRRVAFVEYDNEMLAANAMNALQGYTMNGSSIKITYARR
ncbi:RNA recognition motif-containing protein [Toxoplasma gondii VAND]|uniref:RNA recognition motif-containing protein n=2 Tax=Toxoplasma gondii TaxID=5811 RepID=A0A425I117_TOXGO|nr:RNA recognition motif-containing protein [Toxoplasma gondii VAND]RQX72345.1 RNA recognition motif-containing protein [Toxoplasma gondii CAST]